MIIKTLLMLIVFILTQQLSALMNMPEGISYDYEGNRYFVSCWDGQNVVEVSADGTQTEFASSLPHCANNLLVDDILYITYTNHVKGININTNEEVMYSTLSGALDADGIAMAADGYLYVVSHNGRVYKIDVETGVSERIVTGGVGSYPQDMVYDAEYNRLLICSYQTNCPIYGVDLSTNEASEVSPTDLDNLDGLAIDNDGNIYIASWGSGAIYRIDNEFSGEMEEIVTGLNGPSGIELNLEDNVIYVAGFFSDFVTAYQLPQTSSDPQTVIPNSPKLSNYPNPFKPSGASRSPSTTISFSLTPKEAKSAKLEIYNLKGQLVKTLIPEISHTERSRSASSRSKDLGIFEATWDGSDNNNQPVPSGIYLSKLSTNHMTLCNKMLLLR